MRMAKHPLAKSYGPSLRLVDYPALAARQPYINRLVDLEVAFRESGIKNGVVVVSNRGILHADRLIEDCTAYQTVHAPNCVVYNLNNPDKTQIQKRPPLPELRWPLVFEARFPALILP